MPRILPLFALLAPSAAPAHSGPHLHPHGVELPVVAILALAGAALAAAAIVLRRR